MLKSTSVALFLCLLSACVSIPTTPPLAFKSTPLNHKDNPVYLFRACWTQPGGLNKACPLELYKSNLHYINDMHSELLMLKVDNDTMAANARAHDRADVMRNAVLQDELNRLHWKVAGGVAGGIIIGFLTAIIAGAL